MIETIIFSKSGIDLIMFKPEYFSEIDTIMALDNKKIRIVERREDVVIAQLENGGL